MKKLNILIFLLIGIINLYGSDGKYTIEKQDFSVFDQNGIVISINDSVDKIIEIYGHDYKIEEVNGMITHVIFRIPDPSVVGMLTPLTVTIIHNSDYNIFL